MNAFIYWLLARETVEYFGVNVKQAIRFYRENMSISIAGFLDFGVFLMHLT